MSQLQLKQLQVKIKNCTLCPDMQSQPVVGNPVMSKILLIGQAPGIKEREIHKPFAWTAGKTLFKWFESIGVNEAHFRREVYISAVCRCFPGKKLINNKQQGGDRVPNNIEIKNCSQWLSNEIHILKPDLILPVGKLAISQILLVKTLDKIIGQSFNLEFYGHTADIIPLPHPSGASTWHQRAPGKNLLAQALSLVEQHNTWQAMRLREK